MVMMTTSGETADDGRWDSDGVRRIGTRERNSVCFCDSLVAFALIGQPIAGGGEGGQDWLYALV